VSPSRPDRYPLTSVALLLGAIVSVQCGASFAKQLFPLVGPEVAATLRQGFAALILVVAFRPWRGLPLSREAWGILVLYGVLLGVMNLAFYMAIARIPLGIGVALEFTGPLAIALLGMRWPLDLIWVACAAAGLLGLLPIDEASAALDPLGVILALVAGACWAGYILTSQWSGARIDAFVAVSFGMVISALTTLPIALAHLAMGEVDGSALLTALPPAVAIALLSSAIPYSLEMVALKRLPAKTFAILMSVEPAVAALAGLILLSEQLTLVQWIAVSLVGIASAGATWSSRSRKPLDTPP
jgi:inner membrane transporter RhtA